MAATAKNHKEHTFEMGEYLNDVSEFSLMRISGILDTEKPELGHVNYDFAKRMDSKFAVDPVEIYHSKSKAVKIYH